MTFGHKKKDVGANSSSGLHQLHPKTARGKRFLESRESKVFEDVKKVVFLRSSKTSQVSSQALADLYVLKKPDALMMQRKNPIYPFEGGEYETTLDFFSQRNDAAFALIATHSKKHPDSLVMVRFFDNHILDMVELGISSFQSIAQVGGPTCAVGSKPAIIFNGELFEQSEPLRRVRNLFLDYFRGQIVESLHLPGLETVISLTAVTENLVLLRIYRVFLKKSDARTPRIELQLMGPSMDLTLRRTRWASDDLMKQALRQPREARPKKEKNVTTTTLGETMGRVHVGQQRIDQIQTRKMKALKKSKTEKDEERATSHREERQSKRVKKAQVEE